MAEDVFFYLLSFITVLFAGRVVTAKNPTYAVLSLVVSMFALACLFVLLRAYFVAVIHLLVYAGAVLVLFLFVVMLLGVGGTPAPRGKFRLEALLIALAVFMEIGVASRIITHPASGDPGRITGTIEAVGKLLFTQYLAPFEITSVLLLVGIMGVVSLARKEAP